MAVSFLGLDYPLTSFSTTGSDVAANTQTLNLTTGVSVGDLHVIRWTTLCGASPAPTWTVTDSKGNTYTVQAQASFFTHVEACIATSKITTALTSSDTVTVASNVTRTHREYMGSHFSGVDVVDGSGVTATGTSSSPSISVPTTQSGDLILAALCFETTTASPTWDSAYTGIQTLGTTSGTSDKTFTSAYRVAGASITETPSVTLSASRGWAMAGVAFKATVATTQTAYPTSDVLTTGWSVVPGGTTPFATVLADSDDTTYVQSPNNPSSSVIKVGLTAMGTPTSMTGVVVSYRADEAAATSNSSQVQLVQAPSTVIATWTDTLTSTATTRTHTLTSTQASSVTDWTALQLWFTGTAT